MSRLGVGVDRARTAVAWSAEKLGRLKLNGQLTGYSPLSRLEELEILELGVEGKLLLWQALRHAAAAEIDEAELDRLIKRAQSQHRRLGRLRRDAAADALADKTTPDDSP
jgi:hypothetical protein